MFFQDLGLNLLSEVIGIVITVFLVDKVIQRREEKRWKPAKHLVYAKLLKLIDSFTGELFPMEYLKINNDFVFFGEIEVQPHWIVKSESDPHFNNLLFSLEEKIDAEKDLCFAKLPEVAKKIDEILMQYSYLLEPEIISILMKIREHIDLSLRNVDVPWSNFQKSPLISAFFHAIAVELVHLQSVLTKKATRIITMDEYVKEFKLLSEKILLGRN